MQLKKKTAILPEILENINENMFESQDPEEKKEISTPTEESKLLPIDQPYYKPEETGLPPIPTDIHLWTLPIPDDYNMKNDHSYNVFKYLDSLGYRDAIWHLAESHPKVDVCDELEGLSFTTDWLLFASQHNPPSPIFSRSHPDCRCYVECHPPSNYQEIPDNAPGLPIYANQDTLDEYKRQIFSNLFVIYVDSQTLAPPQDTLQLPIYSYLYSNRTKFAKESRKWVEDIKPIKTLKTFRLLQPLGIYRPMIDSYEGIQISTSDTISQIFFPLLNRTAQVPTELVEELSLKQSTEEPKVDQYVYVDEEKTIGVITRILNDKIYCYIPEFDDTFEVSSVTPLTF